MADTSELDTRIIRIINALPERHKLEVLRFTEYLKMRDNATFLAYVNGRTRKAVEAKQRGERFTSLEDLQQEYAKTSSS